MPSAAGSFQDSSGVDPLDGQGFGPLEQRFFELGEEMSRNAELSGGWQPEVRSALIRAPLGMWLCVAAAALALLALGISATDAHPRVAPPRAGAAALRPIHRVQPPGKQVGDCLTARRGP